jgi:hypothetical protein
MSYTILLQLLGLFSAVTFVGSLIAVPWLIGRMRPDYFITHGRRADTAHRRHPVQALVIWLARNIIGFCLLLAGIAMLFLPGQGLLTILIAVCLMDMPGKQRFLDRLVSSSRIQASLNWIRRKLGKAEFIFENHMKD